MFLRRSYTPEIMDDFSIEDERVDGALNELAAYGKQNILDKTLNRSFAGQKSFLNGIKFHLPKSGLKNILPNEIRIYVSNGIYCGVNEVDNDTITLCFLENRITLRGT
ncbi:MAG: hypothetical protein ACYCVH_14490 [Ignavibacteriaceae bacterium]